MNDETDNAGSSETPPEDPSSAVMDTQAFQRFYLEEPAPPPKRSFVQRLLGWLPGKGS